MDRPEDVYDNEKSSNADGHPSSQGSSTSATPTDAWKCGDQYIYETINTKDAWKECLKTVQKHDTSMVEAWRDEVQFLLIFSGLFSGAVTPFAVGAYKGLQPDPTEMTLLVLTQISAQLGTLGSQNPAPPFTIPSTQPFSPAGSSVRVNIFFFLSLALSLTTALIAILCVQWLREYHREIPLQPKDAIAIRQMRFEGLKFWKVPSILSILPLLLQMSLLMFFIGLLNLLWSLNHTVASLVTVVVGQAVLFIFVSTILPGFQLLWIVDDPLRVPQCAFKTPQSWFFHRVITSIVRYIGSKRKKSHHHVSRRLGRYWTSISDSSWVDYDISWWKLRNTDSRRQNSDIVNAFVALLWVDRNYGQSAEYFHKMYTCFKSLPFDLATQVLKLCRKEQKEPRLDDILVELNEASDIERRDTVSALFLELHQYNYPEFVPTYMELVVRILNSHTPSRPFLRWPAHDIASLPDDIADQFLMAIKPSIQDDRILIVDDIEPIFSLIHSVLSAPKETSKKKYVALSFDIIHELHMWLGRSTQIEHPARVDACTKGMLLILPLCEEFQYEPRVDLAKRFMKVLDEHTPGKEERTKSVRISSHVKVAINPGVEIFEYGNLDVSDKNNDNL